MNSTDMIHGVKEIKFSPIIQQGTGGAYVREITLSGRAGGSYGDERKITVFADKKEYLQIKIKEERVV